MIRFKIWLRVTAHSLALLVLIALGSMTPATALGTDQEFQDAEKFCSSVNGIRDDVSKSLTATQSDQRAAWESQNERMNLMKRQFLTDASSLQNEIDNAHQKNIAALRVAYAKNGNDKAIDDYVASAKQISTSRRAIVKVAQDTFVTSANDILANRQAVRAGQTEAFRIAVDDALHGASVACQDNPETTTVQTTLSQQLKRAREVYSNNQQTDESAIGKLSALETKRDQVIAAANASSNEQLVELSSRIAALPR